MQKNGRTDRDAVRVVDSCGSKESCVRREGGGQDRTSPFAAARGVRSAMRPFAKSLWTLVSIVIIFYSVAAQ